jgi:hypothetical protein
MDFSIRYPLLGAGREGHPKHQHKRCQPHQKSFHFHAFLLSIND